MELRGYLDKLLSHARSLAGSNAALARELSLRPSTVAGWDNSWPTLDNFNSLVSYVGGNLEQALPMATIETVRQQPTRYRTRNRIKRSVFLGGEITAGDGSVSIGYDPGDSAIEELNEDEHIIDLCLNSEKAELTALDAPILKLVVQGSLMSPVYLDGDWVYISAPKEPSKIPDGTAVVFRHKKEGWIKLKTLKKIIIDGKTSHFLGLPFPPTHHEVIDIPKEYCEILGVVLGAWTWPK